MQNLKIAQSGIKVTVQKKYNQWVNNFWPTLYLHEGLGGCHDECGLDSLMGECGCLRAFPENTCVTLAVPFRISKLASNYKPHREPQSFYACQVINQKLVFDSHSGKNKIDVFLPVAKQHRKMVLLWNS